MFKIDRTLRREFDRQDRHEFAVEMISDTGKLFVLSGCREQRRAIHLGLLAGRIQARLTRSKGFQPRASYSRPAHSPNVLIVRPRSLAPVVFRVAAPSIPAL